MASKNTKITLPPRNKRTRRKSVAQLPPPQYMEVDEDTLSSAPLTLGPPPPLTRELTASVMPSPLGHHPIGPIELKVSSSDDEKSPSSDMKTPPPEGFPGLAKWMEIDYARLILLSPGTWVSYTRDSTFIPAGDYAELKEQATKSGRALASLISEYWAKNPPKRKKTVCKVVGYDNEKKALRVESLPMTGQRASTAFPNQTHSWDIPPNWSNAPKYYIVDPAKKAKRKRRVSISDPESSSAFTPM